MEKYYLNSESDNVKERIYKLFINKYPEIINNHGSFLFNPVNTSSFSREVLWSCFPYFYLGRTTKNKQYINMANELLSKHVFPSNDDIEFTAMAAVQIISKFKSVLCPEVRDKLVLYSKSKLEKFLLRDRFFEGVNDNKPAMTAFCLLVGGEILGDNVMVNAGVRALNELAEILEVFGTISEFTSPTYSPISIASMAEIANMSSDSRIRNMALYCEGRIWADILTHYHPDIKRLSGPHSRAYSIDCKGGIHSVESLLHIILGGKSGVNPEILFDDSYEESNFLHHSAAFMRLQCIWEISTDYHCPPEFIDEFLNRRYPFEAKMKAYTSDFFYKNRVYFNGVLDTTLWMEKRYSLGTSTGELATGVSTNSFYLLYSRNDSFDGEQRDIGSVYCRYIINNKKPDEQNTYGDRIVDASNLLDEGRKLVLQYKNTAVVLYKPKKEELTISSLKLSFIIPVYFGMPDEVWMGSEKLDNFSGNSKNYKKVYVRDGNVYILFDPCSITNRGSEILTSVERVNGLLMISFFNFSDKPKEFSHEELDGLLTCIVVRIGSIEEGSFEEFRLSDTGETKISTGKTQAFIKYGRQDLTVSCSFSPYTLKSNFITINGKACCQPKFWHTSMQR